MTRQTLKEELAEIQWDLAVELTTEQLRLDDKLKRNVISQNEYAKEGIKLVKDSSRKATAKAIEAFNKILPEKKTLASDTSYSDKGMHILHEGNGFNQCVDQIKEKLT
tara:strand:+ start:42 stop:365 length:324 start_codon:yes stop_codon:yes gene_type:complete